MLLLILVPFLGLQQFDHIRVHMYAGIDQSNGLSELRLRDLTLYLPLHLLDRGLMRFDLEIEFIDL